MPGLLPRIAIQQRDFTTLKRLYQLHNSQPEIRKMGRFWLKSVMHHAAVDGSMELLQWLHENTEEKCQGDTMGLALRAGHFDIALWLREHRPESMDVLRVKTLPLWLLLVASTSSSGFAGSIAAAGQSTSLTQL
ncbi:hypothetical protein PINS_up020472 [Pythium insidiosum]|nr:hypothetical protein PINS_up020472 [Pythium insidiosum]